MKPKSKTGKDGAAKVRILYRVVWKGKIPKCATTDDVAFDRRASECFSVGFEYSLYVKTQIGSVSNRVFYIIPLLLQDLLGI